MFQLNVSYIESQIADQSDGLYSWKDMFELNNSRISPLDGRH